MEGKVWVLEMSIDQPQALLGYPEIHSLNAAGPLSEPGALPPLWRLSRTGLAVPYQLQTPKAQLCSCAGESKLRDAWFSPILFCNQHFILGNLFIIAVEILCF